MIQTIANDPENKRTYLVVIIERDNFERMKRADPITINPLLEGGTLPPIMFPERFNIVIAYEEDAGPVYEALRRNDMGAVIRHVTRGFTFLAKDGIALRATTEGGNA